MDSVDEAIGLTNRGACPDCGKTYNLGNIPEAVNLTCKQCNFTGGASSISYPEQATQYKGNCGHCGCGI